MSICMCRKSKYKKIWASARADIENANKRIIKIGNM